MHPISASQAPLDVWIRELAIAVCGSGSQRRYCLSMAFPCQKNNGLQNRASGNLTHPILLVTVDLTQKVSGRQSSSAFHLLSFIQVHWISGSEFSFRVLASGGPEDGFCLTSLCGKGDQKEQKNQDEQSMQGLQLPGPCIARSQCILMFKLCAVSSLLFMSSIIYNICHWQMLNRYLLDV